MSGMVLAHLANHSFERDIAFGTGFDYSTMSYVLTPKSTARIIRFTPGGSNTGPTVVGGRDHYTRTTLVGCKALQRASQSDWVLFPEGTLTISPGATFLTFGRMGTVTSGTQTYPAVIGTYNVADPTNIAKYNDIRNPCIIDITGCNHPIFGGSFFFSLGDSEDWFAFKNIWVINNDHNSQGGFYSAIGARQGILFDHCVADGMAISVQTGFAGMFDVATTSITSSGTTATVTHASSTFDSNLVAGTTVVNVAGAVEAVFNGTFTVTRTSSTTFTYTFAGNSNNPATGTPKLAFDGDSIPDSRMITDVIFNKTNIANCGAFTGDTITLNQFTEQVRRLRYHDMVTHHGGWSRNSDRVTVRRVWAPGSGTAISSLGHTAGVATAHTASTAGITANDTWVYISGVTGSSTSGYIYCTQVHNVVANTSFDYYVDQAFATTTTSGGTWALADNGDWDGDIGGSPTDKNHNFYCSQLTNEVKMFRIVSSWDSSNPKLTGGPYYVDGFFQIRDAIGILTDSNGNISFPAQTGPWAWPSNNQFILKNHTQINAEDIDPMNPRGYAPILSGQAPGTGVFNGLLINEDNANPVNRSAYEGGANGRPIVSFFEMRHCISANWGDLDDSARTNTTLTWAHNIMDGPAVTGASNMQWADTSVGFQAKRALLMAKNIHTDFRTSINQLSGVSVGASDLETEDNVCNEMIRNPRTPWHMFLQSHVRQPIGR